MSVDEVLIALDRWRGIRPASDATPALAWWRGEKGLLPYARSVNGRLDSPSSQNLLNELVSFSSVGDVSLAKVAVASALHTDLPISAASEKAAMLVHALCNSVLAVHFQQTGDLSRRDEALERCMTGYQRARVSHRARLQENTNVWRRTRSCHG